MKKRDLVHFSLSLLLAGCASQSQVPLMVLVTPTGYVIDGETFKSRAELANEIVRRKAKIVDIKLDKQISYSKASWDKVGDALQAVRDAGAKVPVVGNISK